MTALALSSFLAFGALLVLYGANSTELIATLGLDYADLGLLGSMLSLGLGVGIVIAGPVIDRFPRRPLFIAACALVAAATLSLGPETQFSGLLVRTIAIGFGAGFYETVLNALTIEEYEENATRRLLFIHSGASFAAMVSPLLFEAMRSSWGTPWYDTFRIAGVLHVLLIFGALFAPIPKHRSAVARPAPSEAETALGTPGSVSDPAPAAGRVALGTICLATFAYVGVESALTIFVADHATSDLGLSASRAAQTISAFWGGLLAGRLSVGLAPRRPGAGTISALASVAALLVFAFGQGLLPTPELAMAAAGFFLGGVFPVMIGLAGLALPQAAGTAAGLAGGLGSLGGFVIPWLTGKMASAGGLPFALSTLSGWLLLLVGAAFFARRLLGRLESMPSAPIRAD
ncbi:MAG: sugar MFS transporter [Myxococcota bacterium]